MTLPRSTGLVLPTPPSAPVAPRGGSTRVSAGWKRVIARCSPGVRPREPWSPVQSDSLASTRRGSSLRQSDAVCGGMARRGPACDIRRGTLKPPRTLFTIGRSRLLASPRASSRRRRPSRIACACVGTLVAVISRREDGKERSRSRTPQGPTRVYANIRNIRRLQPAAHTLDRAALDPLDHGSRPGRRRRDRD